MDELGTDVPFSVAFAGVLQESFIVDSSLGQRLQKEVFGLLESRSSPSFGWYKDVKNLQAGVERSSAFYINVDS